MSIEVLVILLFTDSATGCRGAGPGVGGRYRFRTVLKPTDLGTIETSRCVDVFDDDTKFHIAMSIIDNCGKCRVRSAAIHPESTSDSLSY